MAEHTEKTKTDIWPLSYKNLIDDLLDEPDCLKRCLDKYIYSEGKDLLNKFKQKVQPIQFSKIFFIGNTFNYFASLIPKHCIMSHKEKLPYSVFNFELTEFYDYFINQLDFSDSLFIFISKSGTSRLLIKSIEYILMLKVDPNRIILITDNPISDAAKNCGFSFPIYVGSELILGTKSYQNTVLVLYFLVKILLNQDPFDEKDIREINDLIEAMKEFGKDYKPISEKVLGFLGKDLKFLHFLARGVSLSTAYHFALESKTYSRIYAAGMSMGLFFHGPFQIAEENFRCVFYIGDNQDITNENIINKLLQIILTKYSNSKIVLISNSKVFSLKNQDNPNILNIPYSCEQICLSPIFEMFMAMLFLVESAQKRGLIMFE